MLTLHRAIGTYSQLIDRYIALTHFARSKIIKGGIADHKVVLKPNFVPDPPAAGNGGGGYVAYVGGLLKSKGTETLVAAWRALPMVKLKIVGDGELRTQCEAIVREENLNIEFTGMQNRSAVLKIIANAEILIVPSEWYEGLPMVVAESFACGTPVLASCIGSLEELIDEGVTGKKFTAGDPEDLAQAVRVMLADEAALRHMRVNARAYFDAHLTEEQNYAQLTTIYSDVIADRGRQTSVKHG